jgi:hypothetical protein
MADETQMPATIEAIADQLTTLGRRMDERFAEIEVKLGDRITGVETTLGDRITGVETKLGDRITGVETRLGSEIRGVETNLKVLIEAVDGKVQIAYEAIVALNEKNDARDRDRTKLDQRLDTCDLRLLALESRPRRTGK